MPAPAVDEPTPDAGRGPGRDARRFAGAVERSARSRRRGRGAAAAPPRRCRSPRSTERRCAATSTNGVAARAATKRSTCWRRATRRSSPSRTASSPGCSTARPAASPSTSSIRRPRTRTTTRTSSATPTGLEEGATVTPRPGARLRRHVGQRAGEHAAPALCDLRPRRRQALVAGHADRSVRGLSVARGWRAPARAYALVFASRSPVQGTSLAHTDGHGRTNAVLARDRHRNRPI